mgnify:FL=1
MSPTWLYREGDAGVHQTTIAHCAARHWLGVWDTDDSDRPARTACAGGPGDEPVTSPWEGIHRLALRHDSRVTWTPASDPCRFCERPALVVGIHQAAGQRYERRLCLHCGTVIVLRSLVTAPNAVRLDGGRAGETPAGEGVRWLGRSLPLTPA